MSWQRILQDEIAAGEPLARRVEALFAQQRATWPMLRDGEATLEHLQKKALEDGSDRVVVQLNAARRRSTHAKVDAKAVAARPCFLCPANMPAEERGVEFENLVVMPNPFPVLPRHCTIADREHRPQQLAGSVDKFLRLAAELGPAMAVFYNGPRCGASAPDHFHLQAAEASGIPILAEFGAQLPLPLGEGRGEGESRKPAPPHLSTASRLERPALSQGERVLNESFGRTILLYAGTDLHAVQRDIERALEGLRDIDSTAGEPMFNLLGHFKNGRYTALLFPRAVHRPQCYFAEGAERIGISPAVLEMAGILVVTEPEEFDRVDAQVARRVYEEVSVDRARVGAICSEVT